MSSVLAASEPASMRIFFLSTSSEGLSRGAKESVWLPTSRPETTASVARAR